jgi:PAS domain S-box-containing protein
MVDKSSNVDQELQAKNEFLSTVLESLADPFYVINVEDYSIEIANSAARAAGISSVDTCFALTHHRDSPCDDIEHPCPLAEVVKHKRPITTEHVHFDESGDPRIVEVRGFPIFNENGDVVQMIEYTLDITERRAAEEELGKFSRAVEQSANGILITNLKGEIEFVNPAFTVITGYTAEEVIGKSPRILKSNRNPPQLYQRMWQTITRGEVWQDELVNKKKNGENYWEFITISPIKNKAGATTHYLAIKEDITQRKQAEEKLQHRNQQLALINHASQIFSSTLDLDNVIQSILGEMHRLLNIMATSYWLYLPETGELVCQQASGPGNDLVVGWRLARGQGLSGRAAKQGKPIIVSDTHAEPDYYDAVDKLTGLNLRSLLIIPLRAKGEIIGVLNLCDTAPNRFNDEDIILIESIAAVAASAIKNAHLFDEAQRQRRIAESLRQVSTIINSSLDLNTVLAKILEQLRRVIQFDGAGLFLLDGNDLLLTGGSEQVQHIVGHRIPVAGNNPTTKPLKQKKALVVDNIQIDWHWREDWPHSDTHGLDIRGWMGAPLLSDQTAIGVLTVDSFEPARYTDRDARILQTFANQAATAIQNARHVERTQDALHETQLLYRVSNTLAKNADVRIGVESAMGQLLTALELDQGNITLLKPGNQRGILYAQWESGRPQPVDDKVRLVSPIYQRIIQSRRPIVIADTLDAPAMSGLQHFLMPFHIKSMLLIPLLVRGYPVGVLGANATKARRDFIPREVELAQAVADQIATAIDNASLLEKEQQQRQMAESLREVANVLNSSLDQDVVVAKILEELRNVIRYDSAGLFLVDDNTLVLKGGAYLEQKHIGYRIPVHSEVRTAKVFRSKMPLITPDVREDPYWEPEPTSGKILSWMAVPLISGTEAIGVQTIDSFELDAYTEEDVQVLQIFANQAAIAIKNADLFKQAQQQRQMVEQALTDLKATQNQLVVQEKMASLGMLTAGIAHEIKNPLNFVTSFAQLSIEMAQDLANVLAKLSLSADERAEIDEILSNLKLNARSINESGYRANSIIQGMLLHSRGASGNERQESDINLLVKEAVNLAFHSLRAKDINCDVTIETNYDQTIQPVKVVPQNLSRVFVNLVNNAYDATS